MLKTYLREVIRSPFCHIMSAQDSKLRSCCLLNQNERHGLDPIAGSFLGFHSVTRMHKIKERIM